MFPVWEGRFGAGNHPLDLGRAGIFGISSFSQQSTAIPSDPTFLPSLFAPGFFFPKGIQCLNPSSFPYSHFFPLSWSHSWSFQNNSGNALIPPQHSRCVRPGSSRNPPFIPAAPFRAGSSQNLPAYPRFHHPGISTSLGKFSLPAISQRNARNSQQFLGFFSCCWI